MASLISAQKLTKLFSGKALFSDLSLGIEEGERLGIIGTNGAGKSTLLRVIAGLEELDEGQVVQRRDLKVSYVAQQDVFPDGATVYSVLQDELKNALGHSDSIIARTMSMIGFVDKNTAVSQLSGGWKKRLALARGIINEPELLLLDEPTNHLDIETIEWLEEFVGGLRCAVAFVSHDRYFIEAVATRVIELDRRYPGGYISCAGSYSSFIDYREAFLSAMRQHRDSLANRVRREVEWLRQGAKARTTKSKHRTAEAEKLIVQLKSIQLSERRANVEFAGGGKRSKDLLKAEGISKAMGGRVLFDGVNLLLSPGARLGVVGANGSGKSTLLKILIQQLEPDKGKVTIPHNARISFFDQARKSLDPSLTLEQALLGDSKSVVFNGVEYAPPAWAKRFLFSPEQMKVTLNRLSGGEQARVLIARIMRDPSDILVLDEPTNDLDIQTLEVLEQSLDEFPGAIILVTHDRYLLDRLATQVLGLFGDSSSAMFASYLQWEMAKESGQYTSSQSLRMAPTSHSNQGGSLTESETEELSTIEARIAAVDKEIAEIHIALSDPTLADNPDKITHECARLEEAQARVDALYARWENLESRSGK